MYTTLFNKLVARRTISPSGCWEWQGAISSTGYGNTYWQGQYLPTHRAIWLAVHGEMPSDQLCHTCDNRRCFNPEHLFPGTQADNIADMYAKHREARGPLQGEKIRKGWTPELRAHRAGQTRQRMQQQHEELARAAGVPLDWKFCPKCHIWKPRSDYQRNGARHDGLKSLCRPCTAIQNEPNVRQRALRSDRGSRRIG